jgi:thioredoxin 1
MRSEHLLEITDTNFDDVALKAPLPVLIDFTAAWCAPCRAIAPHIAAIAREYEGRLTVATCDTDSNAELAARLDVRAMPTLLLFKAGQVVGQIVGAVPRAKIEALVGRAVSPGPAPLQT